MLRLDELLERFKKEMTENDISSNTIKNYILDVKTFNNWYQGLNVSPNIKNITFYHLNGYKDYIIDNKRKKVSSINRNIQSLKNFFKFLVKEKTLKKNPADKIRFLRKSKPTQPQALNKQEIHKLLSITSNSSHGTQKRNYAIIQTILHTGMRVGELIGLEFRDLEIYERSGQARIVNAKGGKERTVPLNTAARRALSKYFGKRELAGKDIVFLSKRNKKLTARAIQQLVSNLSKKAGIEINVSPHTLRHTFAVNYLRSNPESLVELSTLLGHESLDTTSIYTIASKKRLKDTVEKMGTYINE